MSSDYNEIQMSSLLAAFLLNNDCIVYSDISKCISDIFTEKGIDICENDNDIDKVSQLIVLDDNKIYLTKKYSDILYINNKKITVYDYLYSRTTEEIIEYCKESIKKRIKVIA